MLFGAIALFAQTFAAMAVTSGNPEIVYGNDFATATLTFSGSYSGNYTLAVGGTDYNATGNGSAVTFSDIATGHRALYDSFAYELKDATPKTIASGVATVHDTYGMKLFTRDSGGTWEPTLALDAETGEVCDGAFTPESSYADDALLEFVMTFSAVSSEDNECAAAKAAIRIVEADAGVVDGGAENGKTNLYFQVSNGGTWRTTAVPAAINTEYTVKFLLNSATRQYTAFVDSINLGTFAYGGSAETAKTVNAINFVGNGIVADMSGEKIDGYMVADSASHNYWSVDAALDAYGAGDATAPLTLKHAGTVEGTVQAKNSTIALDVANIADKGFASIARAIEAAGDSGTTIVLQKDRTEAFGTTKSITLDLGAKTLTYTGTMGAGSVTFQNGTLTVSGGNLSAATVTLANTLTVTDGFTAGMLTDNGAKVPAGYAKTVANNTTITIAVQQIEFRDITFEYMADYQSAKSVTATVSAGDADVSANTWTLTVGENTYTGKYNADTETVTFSGGEGAPIPVTPSMSYTISSSMGGSSAGSTSGTEQVGEKTDWFSTASSATVGGTWTNGTSWVDAKMPIENGNNAFHATVVSAGETVTVALNIDFGETNNDALSTAAKAAVKVATDGNSAVYKVLDSGTWVTTSGTPDTSAASEVKVVFDYGSATPKYSVKIGNDQLRYNESEWFTIADAGSGIQDVAFEGSGSVTSISGMYVSTNVAVVVDGESAENVVVDKSWIAEELSNMTAAEAKAALAPNADPVATISGGGSSYNYFTCYALGLDPADADEKPITSVEVVDGKYVITMKNAKTGATIAPGKNVSVSLKVKYGNSPASLTGEDAAPDSGEGASASFTFDPASAMDGNAVMYYQVEAVIGGK